jgi:hypothetical protein
MAQQSSKLIKLWDRCAVLELVVDNLALHLVYVQCSSYK